MFGTYVVYKHLHRSFDTATENRTCLYCYFCLRERDKIILLFQASLGGCCNVIVKFRGRSSHRRYAIRASRAQREYNTDGLKIKK